jgi:hypothetical protein
MSELANLSSPPQSHSYRYSAPRARHQLEGLIRRQGHPPSPASLSCLRDLTATSSAYNPPSRPSRPCSPISATVDAFETLSISRSGAQPIPIPKRLPPPYDDDLPVTPLTGRFDKGDYFPYSDRPSAGKGHLNPVRNKHSRRSRAFSRSPVPSTMRTDSPTYYRSIVPASMSPTGRPVSPQPSRTRTQSSSKSVPTFHLESLPRFHPAVYQSTNASPSHSARPPSPRQVRQHTYRPATSPREMLWQYRDLVDSVTLPRTPPGPLSPSPSAPRLDPLRSPGPVTPLALEESSGYLVTGALSSSDYSSRDKAHAQPPPDLVERLIAREQERARQKGRKTGKGR